MKSHKKRAVRYQQRLATGERIMRMSSGAMRWASGGRISASVVDYIIAEGLAANLDTDLFGEKSRGQTIGLAPQTRALIDPLAPAHAAPVQDVRRLGRARDRDAGER